MRLKAWLTRNVNRYRVIAAIGFIIATALVLAYPVKMIGASPWSYHYGVENFASGGFVVDDHLHTEQVNDARQQGGNLMQYVEIGDNRWALEKAPGYVFYLVPFQWLGIPRWGNIVLALGMVIVTYILLKRLRDEKTACIGSLLMLFTPVTMMMLNLTYMDTLASLAFLAMGGGLYIYYHLERHNLRPAAGGVILFLAFFLTGWSVVTRYTNLPVAVVLGLHFIITRIIVWRKGEITGWFLEISSVVLGVGLPVAALLIYNNAVFGSPLDYGYNYSSFPIKFAYEYLGQADKNGQSVPLQIILDNLKAAPKALFWGFPLLAIGIPGFLAVLCFKLAKRHQGADSSGRWSSLNKELPWDILLVLTGWFISVFGLYLMYEFTAEYLGDSSLVRFARFYLPGLFPVVIISALVVARLRWKLYIPVMIIAVIIGSIIYAQYVSDDSPGDGRSQKNVPSLQQGNRAGGGQ